MRSLAVLPTLFQRHDVLVLAGSDAYDAISERFPVTRIPTIGYHHNRHGRVSAYLTIKKTLPTLADVALGGSSTDFVQNLVSRFNPDLIISDSELFTHRVARKLGIPRITFDHYALLVYCSLEMSWVDHLKRWASGRVYKLLYGKPERIIASGFFPATSKNPLVRVVGAVIRDEVRQATPRDGEHLLVYVNKGQHFYTQYLDNLLQVLEIPVYVYGAPKTGEQRNVCYKPLANQPFIDDLASCRALVSTAGNQLCGEALYLGKPILVTPMDCLEQRLNAKQIEKLGAGMSVSEGRLTKEMLSRFLERVEEFKANAKPLASVDGAADALEALEQYARDLTGPGPIPQAKSEPDVQVSGNAQVWRHGHES